MRVAEDSVVMLAALGILAYAASMMTHEALGHGAYCLAAGGHTVMLTGWEERCKAPGVLGLGMKAAGPGVQFGGGLLAWLVLRQVPAGWTRLRYFLWLYMVFGLLIASGYVVFSGLTDIGDAAEFIAGLRPSAVWRGGLILLGSLVYFLSMMAAAFELKRFAGLDDESRRLRRIVWVPYVAAGIFACLTGALNRTMVHGAALGFAAASSFGAGYGMVHLPDMQRGMAWDGGSSAGYVTWSVGWGLLAAVVIVVFVFFVGPGLG